MVKIGFAIKNSDGRAIWEMIRARLFFVFPVLAHFIPDRGLVLADMSFPGGISKSCAMRMQAIMDEYTRESHVLRPPRLEETRDLRILSRVRAPYAKEGPAKSSNLNSQKHSLD